jgi:hypothetical protein
MPFWEEPQMSEAAISNEYVYPDCYFGVFDNYPMKINRLLERQYEEKLTMVYAL